MIWLFGIAIVFVAFLLLEARRVRRARERIPMRIVVTGTRGKSSLVRILVAGLRTSEPATWGKVTGDEPLLLASDRTIERITRRGPARIHEQMKLLTDAPKRGVRCLVLESMAISPEPMRAEMRLIRPTLVVVTNVRDDHRETLGIDRDRQRHAYLAALPPGCRWLTTDAELLAFAQRSDRYPTPVQVRGNAAEPPPPVLDGESPAGGTTDVAFELLDLARLTLAELGRDTETALAAMRSVAMDLVVAPRIMPFLGRQVCLLDAFSANDLQSLEKLWQGWRRLLADDAPWNVLLSTRADRPLRTQLFCDWLIERSDVATVFVAGSHRTMAAWLLRRRDVAVKIVAEDLPAGAAASVSPVAQADGPPEILVGVGNAKGLGMNLREVAEAAGS